MMETTTSPRNYNHSSWYIKWGPARDEMTDLGLVHHPEGTHPQPARVNRFEYQCQSVGASMPTTGCCRYSASVQEISPPKIDFCEHVLFTANTMLAVWINRHLE